MTCHRGHDLHRDHSCASELQPRPGSTRRAVLTSEPPGVNAYFGVDASPDGQYMVIDSCGVVDQYCDGLNMRRTADGADAGYAGHDSAEWAPNSNALAFSAFGGIWIRGVDTDANAVQVAQTSEGFGPLLGAAFTPDGAGMAFTDTTDVGARPYLTTQLDGCCERLPVDTRVDGYALEFSPDGTLLSMTSNLTSWHLVRIGAGTIPTAFTPNGAIAIAPVAPAGTTPPVATTVSPRPINCCASR